jgi:hypothetical protein
VGGNEFFLDTRLQQKSIRDGKLSHAELASHLDALEDKSSNLVEFDEEGNPTNLPERELKVLEIKPAEPVPEPEPEPVEIDILAGLS